MTEAEEIRAAAKALADVLTKHGRDYEVFVQRRERTTIGDRTPRLVYQVRVIVTEELTRL